jgi:hypothetical protein
LTRAARSSVGHHVQLVQHQPARLFVQRFVVLLELSHDGLGLRHRVHGIVKRRHVHQMQQQARALQVAQELVPQAGALGRAFDQPRESATTKLCSGRRAPRPDWGAAW